MKCTIGRNARLAWPRAALILCTTLATQSITAQGGPPLVTDDPETPADGHWEVNLATGGYHTSNRWDIVAPDADINFGWGDHIQLKLDVSWAIVRETGQPSRSGFGVTDFGVKWRFLDQEQAGLSMSAYPQLASNLIASSPRRGVRAPGRQLLLPIEAAKKVGEFEFDAEVGRNLVERGPDEWVAGFVVAHACVLNLECLGEARESLADGAQQTLVNLGFHRSMSDTLTILAAAGHEFGPRTVARQSLLLYVGVQVLH